MKSVSGMDKVEWMAEVNKRIIINERPHYFVTFIEIALVLCFRCS